MSSFSIPRLSMPVKLSIFGASISLALIGALAMVFRRRRKKPPRPYKAISNTPRNSPDNRPGASNHSNHSGGNQRLRPLPPARSPTQSRSPNGEIPNIRQGMNTVQRMPASQSGSTTSLRSDSASTSTLTRTTVIETSTYSAEQLCDLGLECVQTAIKYWEEAIERIDDLHPEDMHDELDHMQEQLHHLIGRAYHMRDHYEQRLFRQVSSTVAIDAVIKELDREYEEHKRRSAQSVADSSTDLESFVSALEDADFSDLEKQRDAHQDLALYEAALLELTHGCVPCRSLRTRLVGVASDTEFLAKLHCVRLAFIEIFRDETVRDWFSQMGRQIIADLMYQADRDPEEFLTAYDNMMLYVKDAENWTEINQELQGRGVKIMTFYDIVLDFIMFDAFDDLDNPPSSVTTVVKNRWLSNGFKETALATAVWSVLKAKRRMLKYPKGFIAHFYAISEQTSPVLAWGFLGPEGELKELCYFFRDQVLGFMRDVFSFEMARYTTVEQLADDILRLARQYGETTSAKLAS